MKRAWNDWGLDHLPPARTVLVHEQERPPTKPLLFKADGTPLAPPPRPLIGFRVKGSKR
jgi:hypothetical protein